MDAFVFGSEGGGVMKTVTIRILSDATEQTPIPNPSDSSANKPSSNASKKKKAENKSATLSAYLARRAYYLVKSEATKVMNRYIDAAELYKTREVVDNAMTTIDYAVDLFTATKMGASIGGAVGAVAGFAVGATSIGVRKYDEFRSNAEQLVKSAYDNYFYGTRSGFVAGGHGTEN